MVGGAFIVSDAFTPAQGLWFQKILMKLQVALEESFVSIGNMAGASSENSNIVVLCDRGLMDGSAYVSTEEWNALLNDLGDLTTVQIRDNRYDAIIHLVTAADGAPEFYQTMVDGQARYETPEQAVEKCQRIRTAYFGHHKYSLIANVGQTFK